MNQSAPKPFFSLDDKQPPSQPDEGISCHSSQSIDFQAITYKIRYDRFGNIIDKKRKEQQVSFRDRVTKQYKVYDLFMFDYFKLEKQQMKKEQERLKKNERLKKLLECCSIF